MPNQAERTLKMRKDYISLREQGYKPKEIAEMFQLSPAVVYRNLAAIAAANGTTRDALLHIPRSQHLTHERRFAPLEPINSQAFHDSANTAITEIDHLIDAITDHIQAQGPITLE